VLDRLERRYGRYAISDLTSFMVVGQLIAFVLSTANPAYYGLLPLQRELVLHGQLWRLVSFVLVPPTAGATNLLRILFSLYFTWMFGSALENQWGAFKLNVFLFVSWLASMTCAMLVPGGRADSFYLSTSLFLAFATLNPDFEIYVAFVIPVKVRWIGWMTWAYYLYMLVFGDLSAKAQVLAGTANIALFFGGDLRLRLQGRARSRQTHARVEKERATARHTCAVCGITDVSDPRATFRYCSKCGGGSKAYCQDHLRDHEHV
jgi:membrane associated rhomboid family serine protease